ncbi:restriction endonuclease subunit S [Pseudoalteromonas rhizosphaerae]|uniref:Restriction endonuclease subunit S n=1 Tax=Pseudoalteromonas rhizosphaerae TaxID=2518973 RepID=A0ABW8KZL5_9GAMM
MGVIAKKIKLSSLSLNDRIGLKDYSLLHIDNYVFLKNILMNRDTDNGIKSGRTPSKFNEQYWNGEYEFLTMQDVDKSTYVLRKCSSEHITDYAIENERTLFQASTGDLIFSNAMTVGLSFLVDRNIYINQNVFALKIDDNAYNKVFLKWYFNLVFKPNFDKIHTSKYISKSEVGKIKIPNFEISRLNTIAKKIEAIESEIRKFENALLDHSEIINRVFGEEFDFDWDEFEKIKRERIYNSSILSFANNVDCRMGVRFHNKAGQYVQTFLEKITNKRIKDFISEPIVLGKSVSPNEYDEDGEYFYIAMSNIKTWAFDPEDCKKVSDDYSSNNLNKTVQKGDILLARSGEGTIGKVALIEDEEINGIFADFTQRIRLTGFDPLCAYYYFRSDFFQYLVYTHKKGLGNNTNIFPSQIKEFPMPDWDETKQAEIVKAIKTQLDEQRVINRQIEEKQKAISKIIDEAIAVEQSNA